MVVEDGPAEAEAAAGRGVDHDEDPGPRGDPSTSDSPTKLSSKPSSTDKSRVAWPGIN